MQIPFFSSQAGRLPTPGVRGAGSEEGGPTKGGFVKKLLLFAVCGLPLVAVGLLAFRHFSPSEAAEEELVARARASIAVSWGWLDAADVRVLEKECTERGCRARLAYTLVVKQDESRLTPKQVAQFRQYLAQCASTPLARGATCALTEELLFVETPDFGWMPDLYARQRPDLLPAIAAWQPEATGSP